MSSPRSLMHESSVLLVAAGLALLAASPLAGQNVITNGEFATDLSSWSVLVGSGVWDPLDRNGSPASGSALLTAPDSFALLRQTCLPVVPGATYDFGATIYLPSGQGGSGHSWIRVMWDSDCNPSGIVGLHQTPDFAGLGSWQAVEYSQAAAPIDATFAHLDLAVVRTSGTFSGHVDGVFLWPSDPTPIVVTTPADSGTGSLREAMQQANSDGAPSVITFDPGLAGGTISLATALPGLSEDATEIDGDLDDDCVPDIAVNGNWIPNADGLDVNSNGNRIAGLAIHSFDCPGCGGDLILIANASSNLIECNHLGTDLSGTVPLGTQTYGVKIVGGASGNIVRDNRILYNGTGVGIYEGSSDNTIGPGNEIAFGGRGVDIDEDDLGGFPDFVALTPDAVQAFATIDFSDDCAGFHQSGEPTLFDGLGHPFTEDFGMRLTGDLTLSATGDYLFEIPQLDDLARLMVDSVEYLNVYAPGPHSVTVPGLSAGVHSLELDFFEGGGAARLAFTVSGPGAASLSTGAAPPAGCTASQPGLCGELFQRRRPAEGNRITQNSIHDNSGLGISLNCCCSPLANDPGDADLGANTTLNHPEIASVVPIGGGLYSASGSAPLGSTVEVFVSDGDPSGFGEGREFLASTTADGSGAFSVGLPLELGTSLLTATATDPAGNTSEFGPNYAPTAGSDRVTVGGLSALPGDTVVLPVYVRDASLTPLGLDRPAGERIQGIVFKVLFPGGTIATASAARAGVLAGLTPLWELAPATGSSIAYLGSFAEAGNLIPFNLDAAEPGDVVVELTLTLAASAPAGSLPLTLDTATTELDNQAGTLVENAGNGALALADGQIFVQSNAASWLWAGAESASSVRLTWADPNANETGFRVERSEDGASWTPVGSAGPDDWQFLDTAGLAPATFYLYRLVTLIPQGDSQISNVAPTMTHALQAAKVCSSRLSGPRSRVRFPAVAWSGDGWGTVAQVYDGDQQGDLYFQRLNSADLAPVGPAVRLTATDAASQYPTLRWNGSHYGLLWYENLRGEPDARRQRQQAARRRAAAGALRRLAAHEPRQRAGLGRHPLGLLQQRVEQPAALARRLLPPVGGGRHGARTGRHHHHRQRPGVRDRRRLQPHRQPVRGGLDPLPQHRRRGLVPARRGVERRAPRGTGAARLLHRLQRRPGGGVEPRLAAGRRLDGRVDRIPPRGRRGAPHAAHGRRRRHGARRRAHATLRRLRSGRSAVRRGSGRHTGTGRRAPRLRLVHRLGLGDLRDLLGARRRRGQSSRPAHPGHAVGRPLFDLSPRRDRRGASGRGVQRRGHDEHAGDRRRPDRRCRESGQHRPALLRPEPRQQLDQRQRWRRLGRPARRGLRDRLDRQRSPRLQRGLRPDRRRQRHDASNRSSPGHARARRFAGRGAGRFRPGLQGHDQSRALRPL